MTGWELTGWAIERSKLHHPTWVPVSEDSDYECFLHAGPLGAVKEWVEEQADPSRELALRWRKENNDRRVLEERP